MQRLNRHFKYLLICTLFTLTLCPAARGEDAGSSSINIRQVADGLVVIVNSSQKSLDDVRFDCSQETNEIIVDLPATNDAPTMAALKTNPLVAKNGLSSTRLSREMIQARITPKLKLKCSGLKMVSRFQRYITYLYPAGRDLRLESAELKGFEFDENRPRPQVSGSLLLKFNEPLGNVDLSDAVSSADNRLSINLNPKDFVPQETISRISPPDYLSLKISRPEPYEPYILTFDSIKNSVIGKVKAKTVKSAESDELRIDLTLSVSLYDSGKKFYQEGDSRKALLYMDAAKNDPSTALVSRMSAGTIFWNDDNHKDAAKSFKELVEMDRGWEFPEARYFLAKTYYLANNRLSFELTAMLKEFLRRCDRMKYATCGDARELSDQVNEPALKLFPASRPELKKLTAKLADPRINQNEVQKNIFHYWATWCPLCLEEMPKIMKYAVAHPNVSIYIVAKNDTPKVILNTLLKAGAIRRSNIFYYIDTRDDIMLRQTVPLILANKEPVTPLPISVFMQREIPFYITDRLDWNEAELSKIWKLKYSE